MRKAEDFLAQAEKVAFNAEHRDKMFAFSRSYEKSFYRAKQQFSNLELARTRAAYLKWKITENLDKYLIDFESNVIRRGGKVLWADDAKTALTEIEGIIEKHQAKTIIKSKTGLADEIGLNDYLRSKSFDISETDLGEFIIDVAKEKSYHMVLPAIHKSRAEIAGLLNDKVGISLDAEASDITRDVRDSLRKKFTTADIGITGANFLLADTGQVALTENEGNIRLTTAFSKVHIVIAGIDKLIPSINDLDLFFSLLATYGTSQHLTSYNTIVGPKSADDIDGPTEFIVLLVDNGRSNLLAQHDQRQALGCIRCGACLNVCPVYLHIGGHAYGASTPGPIGAVINQHINQQDDYKHLSYSSPVCGKCTEMCPVKIDIHNHLVRNRKDDVQQTGGKYSEKLIWYSWKKFMLSRKNMNKALSIKSFMLKSMFKSAWGERREFPKLADKSFNQLWRERFGQ